MMGQRDPRRLVAVGLALAALIGSMALPGHRAAAAQRVQISYWYGIGGELGKVVQTMVARFNATPPTTWPELAADAKKLTHGSGANKVYGFNPLVDWWPWESYTLSAGGQFFNQDATQATFDGDAALAPLRIQQSLVKSGYAKVNTG